MQLRYLIFSLLCLLTLISTTQAQKIFYVTPTGSSAPASATTLQASPSWASSTTDLQGAINEATSGDQVWVAAGTYKPGGNANTNRTISFAMKNGVAIYGGFVGSETALGQRPAINPVSGNPSSSTLSGEIGNPNSTTDNSFHVISNPAGLTTTAVLDGFVITGGNANGSGNDAVGGGIANNGSGTGQVCSPSVENCLLVSNAANIGAGIYNNGSNGGNSSPLLLNCLFQNNTAGQFGGGIQNNAASNGSTLPRLVNCGFVANQAGQSGGALSNDGQVGGNSSPLLVNCSFLANTAPTGGAMLSFGASGTCNPRLTNSVLWNNAGGNTFNTISATVTASYSLFDAASFLSDPTNLTTATSPFASALSVELNACSPALNVGSNASYTAAVGTPPSTDLAGNPRIYPTGGTIDLGAIEFQASASASAPPARLYVSASQTAVNGGDGLSWATAFRDLQRALSYPCSQSLTEIWVAGGVYKPTSGTARSASFAMLPGVKIYGGFAGITVSDPVGETALSGRPAIDPVGGQPSSSTLSGEIGDPNSTTDNSYHVISNPVSLSLTTTAVLDGFVITAGNANGAGNDGLGGGIFNTGSSPTLSNCSFLSNRATNGGAINNLFRSSPALSNCTFLSNEAANNGGGIVCENSSSPTLSNCTFLSNGAVNNGGGIYSDNSNPTLTNCSFLSNTATNGGAILSIFNSNPTLNNCSFQRNRANNGGAMFNQTGSPTLSNCSFLSNTATQGGAMFNQTGSPTLSNCSFLSNTANLGGAILSIINSNPTLTNCSFQSNMASSGGAMFNQNNSSLTLSNCSFQSNAATGGGAIFNSLTCSAMLTNCVLWNNGAGTTFVNANNASVSASYSLFEVNVTGYTSGPGNLTTTTSPFVSATSVALDAGSPAINTGNPASVTVASPPYSETALPTTDLAGNPRIVGCRVDMGAVEYQYAFTPPTRLYVSASQTAVNGGDGLSWATAFRDLQRALTYPCSQSLTEIWVAGGVYKPTSTTARTISFAMRNGLAIIGGFVGSETALSGRPAINPVGGQPSSSTLSGDIGTVGDNTDNSYHVISNPPGLDVSAVLDGFVITAGNANGSNFPDFLGGGVYNNGSSGSRVCNPSFRNCILQSNQASGLGGAMYNNGGTFGQSSPVLTNCTLQSNQAINGGAMYNNGSGNGQSSPVLTNCTLQGNSASSQGGAMVNNGSNVGQSNPVLTNCTLQGNSASSQGGAMVNIGSGFGQSSPVLANCVLWNNGGGNTFVNDNASVSATYSLFEPSSLITGVNVSGPGNLTNVTTSPFVSASSVALNACSPAINAGGPASITVANGPYSATALPQTDLTNLPRIVGNRVDMGAVEFTGTQQFPLSVTLAPASGSVVCAGSAVTVPVGVTGTVTAYQWYKDGVSLNVAQSTSALSLSNVQVADAGSYSVVVTGGCNALTSTAFSLTVNPLPTSPALTSGTLSCAQTSVTLTATAGGATTFTLLGGSGPQSNTTGLFAVSTPAAYTALLATINGCTVSTTATLSQDVALPSLTLTPASATLTCQNPSLTLTASSSANSASFAFGGGGTRLGNNQLQLTQGGTYSVTVTAPNGCTNTTQAGISQDVNAPTGLSLSASNSGVLNCTATSLTLTASATGNSLTFVFSGPGGSRNGPVQLVNLPGTYSVVVTAGNGCTAATTTSLSSDTAIQATLTASNTALCSGASALLTAGGGAGLPGSSYRFTGPGGVVQSGLTNTLSATQTGLYAVTVTAGNGCTASQTLSLTLAPAPNAQLTFLNGGAVVQATGGVSYFFVQPIERINGYEIRETASSRDGFFNLKRPGPFWVLVTGANGCSARVDGVSARP